MSSSWKASIRFGLILNNVLLNVPDAYDDFEAGQREISVDSWLRLNVTSQDTQTQSRLFRSTSSLLNARRGPCYDAPS